MGGGVRLCQDPFNSKSLLELRRTAEPVIITPSPSGALEEGAREGSSE